MITEIAIGLLVAYTIYDVLVIRDLRSSLALCNASLRTVALGLIDALDEQGVLADDCEKYQQELREVKEERDRLEVACNAYARMCSIFRGRRSVARRTTLEAQRQLRELKNET